MIARLSLLPSYREGSSESKEQIFFMAQDKHHYSTKKNQAVTIVVNDKTAKKEHEKEKTKFNTPLKKPKK
jgi:hypothetical protein